MLDQTASASEIKSALDRNSAEIEYQNCYCISFEYDGKTWGFHIWATSFEDAELKCQALRSTAKVDGELVETIPFVGEKS